MRLADLVWLKPCRVVSWRRAGARQGQRRRGEAREIEEAKKQARTTDFREPEPSPSLSTRWPWRSCPGRYHSRRWERGIGQGGVAWARTWMAVPRYHQARQGKASCKPPARWPAVRPSRKETHLTSRLVAEKNGAARPSAAEWVSTQNKPCPQPNRATHRNPAHQGCPFLPRVLVLWCAQYPCTQVLCV